jgi:hypothetical protein
MKRHLLRNLGRFFVVLVILGMAAFAGYELLKPKPDPLAGWQIEFMPVNPSVEKDCQDYTHKLPPDEKPYAHAVNYFKDGTGQHAVLIEVDLNGTAWNHVLFYDKDNKRIKILKYVGWHHMSRKQYETSSFT